MSELGWFNDKYLPKNSNLKIKINYAISYSRVSSKEQADNNMSLDTQIKQIRNYAKKSDYKLVQEFGGTHESAKTDERIEFNKMKKFALNPKNKIDTILITNFDRFSRSGASSMLIIRELKDKGINVVSVNQNINTNNGLLASAMNLVFSNHANETR